METFLAPSLGTAGVLLVGGLSFAGAAKWDFLRNDKTALCWLLCAPAIAHQWGEYGSQSLSHTWLEQLAGIIPWYGIVLGRQLLLHDEWFSGPAKLWRLVFVTVLIDVLLLVVGNVADVEFIGTILLFVTSVPPTALVLVQTLIDHARFGHVRDALLLMTTATWLAHLWPELRPLVCVFHPLVLVRIVWPSGRPEYENWFFQVSELSDQGILAFLAVADDVTTANHDRIEELQTGWRGCMDWQECKTRHESQAQYDRLKRQALQGSGYGIDGDRFGPETVAHRLRQIVHEEFGHLLRKPLVQMRVRRWLRNQSQGNLQRKNSEQRGLMLEEISVETSGSPVRHVMSVNLDDAQQAQKVADRFRQRLDDASSSGDGPPLLPPSSSSDLSSSSEDGPGARDEDDVTYTSFGDMVARAEENTRAPLQRTPSLLERLERERREFMAQTERPW